MAEVGIIVTQPSPWSIRRYEPGDEEQILRLFKKVFGRERSLAHWQWKYRDNPEGAQILVAVTDAGEVVGHYAGIPVRVTVDRKPFSFSILGDNMVDRDYRLGLKKPGISTSLLTKFTQDCGGHDRAAVMYGFPTPEMMRMAQRLNEFNPHHAVRLVRSVDGEPRVTSRQRIVNLWRQVRYPVRQVDRFDAAVDRLWERCRDEMRVAIVRDARYVNWRYADCPDVTYRLLQAGGTMGFPIVGIAVLRLGMTDEAVAFLMDWLVPSGARGAADQLLGRCLEEARLAGMKELRAWLPPSSPWHQYLLDRGFLAGETDFIGVRSFTPAVPFELLDAHWYYTLGDSDIL